MKPLALFFLLLGGLPAADISSYSDQASRLIGAALEDIKDAIRRINALMADAAAPEWMSRQSPRSPQRSPYRN